jgi:hypothetical protein
MPTIKKPNEHFDATLWTGDGATTRSLTNASGFRPDLIWIKGRSNTGSHTLQDSNRGFGTATKLSSNSTNAENNASADATDPIYGYVTAVNSNGFTVNNGTTPTQTNQNGTTFVGWQWKAGGASTVNTSGTISSNVSVNTTAGFSIATFTGTGANATVGHGLGVAPKMYIVKNRSAGSTNWVVYHASLGATKWIELSQTTASQTSSSLWNDTAPTSTVFSVGNAPAANGSTNSMVAYCWAEIAGFSAFGSYTGNNSTDGPFLYTGFRPSFIMIKASSGSSSWTIQDASRDAYNLGTRRIYADLSDVEDTTGNIDYLSNGFKLRGGAVNGNGTTFIYMAFAESPFKFSNAR